MSKTNSLNITHTPHYIKDTDKRVDTRDRFQSMYQSARLDLMLTEEQASKYPMDYIVECYLIKDMLDSDLSYIVTDTKRLLRVVGNSYSDITIYKLIEIMEKIK